MRMVRPPYSKEYCACAAVLASQNAATAKSFFIIDPPEQVQSRSDPKLRQFQLRDLHHFHDISRGSAALVQCVPGSQSKLRRRTRSISGETAGSRATDYSKTSRQSRTSFSRMHHTQLLSLRREFRDGNRYASPPSFRTKFAAAARPLISLLSSSNRRRASFSRSSTNAIAASFVSGPLATGAEFSPIVSST